MQTMTPEEFADYLEGATITASQDHGFAIVHVGSNALGQKFIAVNDLDGNSTVTEAA